MSKSLYVDIPQDLYDLLDTYCFNNKVPKKEVVIATLWAFLINKPTTPRAKSVPEIMKEVDTTGYPSNIGIGTEVKREPYEE